MVSNKSKVSIIIPVYNTEKYLEQCIGSVVNQTIKEIDIICVNDASTDGSLSILKSFANKDKRIKIIDLPENTGGGKAKNIAIEQVKTEFFMIVDSDDWVDEKYCEIPYLKAIKDKADIVCCSFVDVVTNIKSKATQISGPVSKLYTTAIIQENRIKFYEGKGTHDTPFFVATTILCKKKSYLKHQYLYYHRSNRLGSIQSSFKKTNVNNLSIFLCYDFIRKYLEENQLDTKLNLKFLNKKYNASFVYQYKKVKDKNIFLKMGEYNKKYRMNNLYFVIINLINNFFPFLS